MSRIFERRRVSPSIALRELTDPDNNIARRGDSRLERERVKQRTRKCADTDDQRGDKPGTSAPQSRQQQQQAADGRCQQQAMSICLRPGTVPYEGRGVRLNVHAAGWTD